MHNVIRALFAPVACLALIGCAGNEVKTSINEVPAAVRATIEKEAGGGKITEFEKESHKGKTVYSADITDNSGKKWDVDVAEDGTLISKKPD
jgi:hypothetical protein